MSTPTHDFHRLTTFVSSLTFSERKALITLARSQSIPEYEGSPILFDKVSPILNRLTNSPPFLSYAADTLNEDGEVVVRFLTSPLTTGLLIVYALGVELTDEQVREGKLTSFRKELEATQTRRRDSEWNWPAILDPRNHPNEIIHPVFPRLSHLQSQFSSNIPALRRSYRNKIIRPHYSNRGVSSQSARWLINRVDKRRIPKWGPVHSFHRKLSRRNICSRDIVHHYVRTGEWADGLTEMKQRWYPSGILPRTYFSWSGPDIANAGYLREFFNDLGDAFTCTDRHNRVQPDWLRHSGASHQGFVFYDLTSFTSWFHEQVPFLRAIADLFRHTVVYLVGEGLTISENDIGSMIDAYTDYTSDFCRFVANGNLCDLDYSERIFTHQCAGFLGIPGNLITCTLAHGLAQAALQSSDRNLQCPGDDIGASFTDRYHMVDIMKLALTLGVLQFEKVYRTPELCIYLKRLVIETGEGIRLAPMLVFPLLPYLVNPNTRNIRSNRFRLPDRDKIHARAASVISSFLRDLWRMTHGDIDSESEAIILQFIRLVHDQIGLPYGAIFQGRLYGEDDDGSSHHYPDISVKFPVDDDRCLRWNPDRTFASKYITRMIVRDTTAEKVDQFVSLEEGESVIVRNGKGWRFLEDMGYVSIEGIPGEKIELIGSDARDAFLYASEPVLRRVRVLGDLSASQLVAAGILRNVEAISFLDDDDRPGRFDLNMSSWRYRRYVDLDDVGNTGIFGAPSAWVDQGLSVTRASLSPEPDSIGLAY